MIAGERERKRGIERAREVYIGPAILLEATRRQEVERLGCVARGRERQRARFSGGRLKAVLTGGVHPSAAVAKRRGRARSASGLGSPSTAGSGSGASGRLHPTAEARSNGSK